MPQASLNLCEIEFYGAFVLNHRAVLHAIDALARWRGGAGSSQLDRAPDGQLADFHTGLDKSCALSADPFKPRPRRGQARVWVLTERRPHQFGLCFS